MVLLNILMSFGIKWQKWLNVYKRKIDNFDPYNVLLPISTNVPILLKTVTCFILRNAWYWLIVSLQGWCLRCKRPIFAGAAEPRCGARGPCFVLEERETSTRQLEGWERPCFSSCRFMSESWTSCFLTTAMPSPGTPTRMPVARGPPACCSSPRGGSWSPLCEWMIAFTLFELVIESEHKLAVHTRYQQL